jgi:hypothetical protein
MFLVFALSLVGFGAVSLVVAVLMMIFEEEES